MESCPRILIFSSHYYPGFRAGGPPKSIFNLVHSLSSVYNFFIFTRDRDVGDHHAYDSIKPSSWNPIYSSSVYYAAPSEFGLLGIFKILIKKKYNIIYLNSFFGYKHSIVPFFLFFIFNRDSICLLSPRGELNPGALSLKSLKKNIYLFFFKRFYSNCKRLNWHATNPVEFKLIREIFEVDQSKIFIAPNLPESRPFEGASTFKNSSSDMLDVVFVSRITPMKNLLFLLEALMFVQSNISLSVYGPIRDLDYWRSCLDFSQNLPDNVHLTYLGELEPHLVTSIFAKHHLFVLPTLGENYGHIIVESLAASTPVLISDRTPWSASKAGGLSIQSGFVPSQWASTIDAYAGLGNQQWTALRSDALDTWNDIVSDDQNIAKYIQMFDRCSKHSPIRRG